MKLSRHILLLGISFLFLQTGCDQVHSVQQRVSEMAQTVKGFFGGEEEKKPKEPVVEEPAAPEEEEAPAPDEPLVPAEQVPSTPPSTEPGAEGVPPSGETTLPTDQPAIPAEGQAPAAPAVPAGPENSNPVSPAAPEAQTLPPVSANPDGSIPITAFDHFGGVPTAFNLGDRFVIVGFGRKLVYLDNALKVQGSLNLEAPATNVTSVKRNEETLLFVQEQRNVLEIVRISREGAASIVKSFQVQGTFDGGFLLPSLATSQPAAAGTTPAPSVNSVQLFVHMSDRIQVLDATQPAAIQVVHDIPIGAAKQVFPLGRYLYIVRGSVLNVVSRDNMAILSSVPLNGSFKILGTWKEKETDFLVIALTDVQTGKWQTIQLMPLAKNGGGISDVGQALKLAAPAEFVTQDQDHAQLYLIQDGKLGLFDLAQRKELPLPEVPLNGLRFVQGGGGMLFAASDEAYTRLEYDSPSADEPKKAATEASAPGTDAVADSVPDIPALANMPDDDKKPIVKWTSEKVVPFPGQIAKLYLAGNQSALIVNLPKAGRKPAAPALFYTKNLGSPALEITPLDKGSTPPADFSLMKVAEFGILLYEPTGSRLYSVKKDFSGSDIIEGVPPAVSGMAPFFDGKTDYLYVTTAKKEGGSGIHAFTLESAKQVKKAATLALADAGGMSLYNRGRAAVVACGTEGVCLVDLGTSRPEMKLVTTLKASQAGARATEVLLSPDEQIAYVFYEAQPTAYISVVNLKAEPLAEIAVIPNLTLSAAQFRGATFSYGGQRLILPQDYGLNVYDVSQVRNPKYLFRWNLGLTYFADVTNRGQTLCAALGEGGVECGQFQVVAETPLTPAPTVTPQPKP